jgi:hypothetical protein
MPELAFLGVGGAPGDLVSALADEVGRQDAVGLVCDEPLAEAADRVHVVVLGSAEPAADALPDLSRSILVALASPPSERFAEGLHIARRAGALFHVNAAAVADLRDRDLWARHLPLGYVSAWDRFDPAAAPGLAVLRSDHGYFDWPAALRQIHSGSVVLHERSRGMAPLLAGRHLFVGGARSLDSLADALRRDPERLVEVRSEAIGFLRDALPLGRAAAALIGDARGVAGRAPSSYPVSTPGQPPSRSK